MFITFLHLFFDPSSKWLFHDSVDNITNPLLWNLENFCLVRQILEDNRVIVTEHSDIIHRKAIVERYTDMRNI